MKHLIITIILSIFLAVWIVNVRPHERSSQGGSPEFALLEGEGAIFDQTKSTMLEIQGIAVYLAVVVPVLMHAIVSRKSKDTPPNA